MKRKMLSMILAVTMAAAMLTGCGGSSSSATDQPETAAETTTESEETVQPEEAVAGIDWPNGTINFINPAAAGGETDVYGRLFNRYLETELGTSTVTTNMAGGAERFPQQRLTVPSRTDRQR